MPPPTVPAMSPTWVYPGLQFGPRRYPLTDHLPPASTSAVGTYHNPVSPKKVVVAGRVPSSDAAGVVVCWDVEGWGVDGVWAAAAPANSRHAASGETRNAVVISCTSAVAAAQYFRDSTTGASSIRPDRRAAASDRPPTQSRC